MTEMATTSQVRILPTPSRGMKEERKMLENAASLCAGVGNHQEGNALASENSCIPNSSIILPHDLKMLAVLISICVKQGGYLP